MAYAVKTTNRFILEGSESSDSESDNEITTKTSNVDPFSLIKQAEKNATKNTKQMLKAEQKMAQNEKTNVLQSSDADNTANDQKRRGPRNDRREPKANNAPRYGKRFEKNQQNEIENIDNKNQAPMPNNENRRETRQNTKTDRRSANPRTGVRAQEKRSGGGRGNWGKPTEVTDEIPVESLTPEENPEEKTPEEAEEKEEVPAEPEVVEFTLAEFRKQAGNDDELKKTEGRKANDGQQVGGVPLARKEIYQPQTNTLYHQADRNQNKTVITNDKLNFISRGGRGYRYFDNNRDNNRRGGRNQARENQAGDNAFTLETEAFPTLGGARK